MSKFLASSRDSPHPPVGKTLRIGLKVGEGNLEKLKKWGEIHVVADLLLQNAEYSRKMTCLNYSLVPSLLLKIKILPILVNIKKN